MLIRSLLMTSVTLSNFLCLDLRLFADSANTEKVGVTVAMSGCGVAISVIWQASGTKGSRKSRFYYSVKVIILVSVVIIQKVIIKSITLDTWNK